MKRPPRPVVVVSIRGSIARLTVAMNGAGYDVADVVALAAAANVDHRRVRGAVLVGARSMPTIDAAARVRGVIVQRRKGATTTEPPAFQPQVRSGVDDQVEPVHGCAGAVCRMPGCHRARRAS